jgi:hypothetical protein
MSRYIGFALLVTIMFTYTGLQAAAIQVHKTGQTSCWDDSGNVITCAGTGQDGEKQAGAAWPSQRFLDRGDGTILDNFTGLIWLKNANCQGIMGWQQALSASNAMASGSCGLTDGSTAGQWRLPNRKELLSLQSYQQSNGTTWLSSQGFSNAQSDWYWTSDTYLPDPGQKWLVHTVGAAWPQSEVPAAAGYFVLPVRGPVATTVGFNQKDIGSVNLTGSLTSSNSVYSLSGSGSDIWLTADSFSFGYQTLIGDGQITARVASLQNTDPWAKSGVMIRETLSADSAHAMMVVTAGNGANFQRRLSTGASSLNTGPLTAMAPYWVKLVRNGSTFTGYASPDGITWTLVGSDTVSMASTVYIGLAVTSHNSSALCTATFDGVTVNFGNAPPAVQITAPANGATFTAPASIKITATATASTGGAVTRVDFYQGTTLIGNATASPYSVSWSNVAAGNYTLTAKVTDTQNTTATSSPVTVTVASGSAVLPAPWASSDIGNVGVTGSASYQNGVYSISGAGSDIWGSADQFNYLYRPLTGDGQIVTRLVSQQNTNAWAKAGLMIRNTLATDASYAMMAATPINGTTFQRRLSAGSFYLATAGPTMAAPCWLKLVRSGNTFTGYVSADGITWVLAGSDKIVMQSTVYVGFAVTSHNTSMLGTATFDSVQ